MTLNPVLDGTILNLTIEGRLDTNTAPQLEALFADYKEITEANLDFSELEYISSAGLRVLLSEQKYLNSVNGKMTLKNVNETIMEVFEVTGFVDILTIL